MHRTESHYSNDGKGLGNLKAWQHILDDPSPPNEFAMELHGGENRGPIEEHIGASQTGGVGAAMCPAFCWCLLF